MKPKINRAGNVEKASGYDKCMTPPYALEPLWEYLPITKRYWEPAYGDGHIFREFDDRMYSMVGTDITMDDTLNYFVHEPYVWDISVTNPPFSLKFQWLQRSYDLGKPFALLLPVEVIGASKTQEMMKKYGCELMLLDSRVDFKMPDKGWTGKGAQFPVLWYCWNILPRPIMYGEIKEAKNKWKKEFLATLPVEPEEKDEV